MFLISLDNSKDYQAASGQSSEKETSATRGPDIASVTRTHSPLKTHQKQTVQLVETVNLFDSERRKVSVEDVERLAASASVCRRPDSRGTAPASHA